MSSNQNKRTEIGSIGEFGLIENIKSKFEPGNENTIKGIGDDAAVLRCGDQYDILVSTDMLLEGIHFDLTYMPLMHLGYKVVSVNVSDIAAMNGIPTQITVNLGLSNRFSVEAVEALYLGIKSACTDYNIDLVGGDTTSSSSGLVISITAIGKVLKGEAVYRSGARDKDILCVTGDIGAAYLGLQVLEREKAVFKDSPEMQPKITDYKYIIERQLKPIARMDIIHELAAKKLKPTSMIDISDGLASELMHLSTQSGLKFKVYEENLPMDVMAYETAIEFKIDTASCMLNGGEDYELLFTISQEDFKIIEKHPDIHFIGYADASINENVLITKSNNVVPIKAQGWVHF